MHGAHCKAWKNGEQERRDTGGDEPAPVKSETDDERERGERKPECPVAEHSAPS
jgi:hypothetical protein